MASPFFLKGVGERVDIGRTGGWGREAGTAEALSPLELTAPCIPGSGTHLPVYTPGGPLVSDLKPTLPRALHFCPSLSHSAFAPTPTPAGHLLAGELVDALDVVADASIDTIGLGRLVALPGVPRPG